MQLDEGYKQILIC